MSEEVIPYRKGQTVWILVSRFPHDVIIDYAYQNNKGLFYSVKASNKSHQSNDFPASKLFKTREEALESKNIDSTGLK